MKSGKTKTVAKTGSKNNPSQREGKIKKLHEGREIEPIFYDGSQIGEGKYMAVQFSDNKEMMLSNNKPVAWSDVA